MTIPELTLEHFYWGEMLSPKEDSMVRSHGEVARSIISSIPRLEEVAEVVARAAKPVDVKAFEAGNVIAVHATIIRFATEIDMLHRRGRSKDTILEHFRKEPVRYPKVIVDYFEGCELIATKLVMVELEVDKIKNGMYIHEDVKTQEGVLIVSKGYRVNETVRNRLMNFAEEGAIDHLIKVLISR